MNPQLTITFTQSGHNVDPAKYRQQNEKITDTLRGMFEKATGKKVCFTMELSFKMALDTQYTC